MSNNIGLIVRVNGEEVPHQVIGHMVFIDESVSMKEGDRVSMELLEALDYDLFLMIDHPTVDIWGE